MVARSGVGKVNAAITTYVLINQFDVSSIIFTGIAGAASPKLNVADVVISTALVQHDVDLTAFGAPKGQLHGYDDRYLYAKYKDETADVTAVFLFLKHQYSDLIFSPSISFFNFFLGFFRRFCKLFMERLFCNNRNGLVYALFNTL